MKIKIKGQLLDVNAVWMEGFTLKAINQKLLPFKFEILEAQSFLEVTRWIKELNVRGAPTIGATGAYGYVLAAVEVKNYNREKQLQFLNEAYNKLLHTRPTAVDLKNALDYMHTMANISTHPEFLKEKAEFFVNKILEQGKQLVAHGSTLIHENAKILTHCNTGPLALVDYGSALGVIIYSFVHKKTPLFVWVDETRPVLQGARLTTWELTQHNIPFSLITDNMAGFLMNQRKVDLIIVGADRVTQNGDIANKIGTYSLAILAHYHNIPFYVAFPWSTIDLSLKNGNSIPIEERSAQEVLTVRGIPVENQKEKESKKETETVNYYYITAPNTPATNFAFDVTPHELITGYITPAGVFSDINNVMRSYKDAMKELSWKESV